MADAGDLKSPGVKTLCGFESRSGHWRFVALWPVQRRVGCGGKCHVFAVSRLRLIGRASAPGLFFRRVICFCFGEAVQQFACCPPSIIVPFRTPMVGSISHDYCSFDHRRIDSARIRR